MTLDSILDRSGDPATVAWAHDGTGAVATLADPQLAIQAAERLGNIAALQTVNTPKDLRKAASAALHRIRSRGVKVDAPAAPRSFTLAKETVNVPPRAFLSLPDDDGDLQLLLAVTDHEGSCVFATIVGGPERIREARHAHVNRSELRDVIRATEAQGVHAELPFIAGLHYADRIFAGRREHGWEHFLEHVDPATLASARLLDPLRRLPEPRADEPEPHPWMPNPSMLARGPLAEGVSRIAEVVTSSLYPTEEARRAAMDEVMNTAADAALDADARKRLSEYLELVVAGCRHYGWPRHAEVMEEVADRVAAGHKGSAIPGLRAAVQMHVATTVVKMTEGVGGV